MTTESPLQTLPVPVTSKENTQAQGRIDIDRSVVPAFVAFSSGLLAISSDQPKAALLFVGAGVVIIGSYFMVLPADDGKNNPVVVSCLRKLPYVFTAVTCILIVTGIGFKFDNEVASIIPLYLFISFATLAALFGTIIPVWITAALYGVGLISLLFFVVLACLL